MPAPQIVSDLFERFKRTLSACNPVSRSAPRKLLPPPVTHRSPARVLRGHITSGIDQILSIQNLPVLLIVALIMVAASATAQVQKSGITPIHLTPAEKAWLENHKTIRVGIAPIFPPLKFLENGTIKGLEPDYLDLLSEYTGIRFEFVTADLPGMDAMVKSGHLDMFLSFYIPERLSYMTFTKPFTEFKQVFVARTDTPFISGISALRGKKIATVKGVKLYDKLLAPHPDITAVPVDTMEQMFRAVSESRADALITKTFFAGYLISNYPNLKIAGIAELPPEPYLYAVRKDYPELVGILNKAIASIPADKRDAILQKWFSMRLEYKPNWSETLKWVLAIGGGLTLVLGLTIFWNRRIRLEMDSRIVAEKTLRESEEQLKVIFETSEAGIILVSPQGVIDFSNRRMAEMFGMTPQELIGSSYTAHLHRSEQQAGDETMRRLITGEIESVGLDRHYIRKDGSGFWGHLSGRRLEHPDGRLRGLVGVIDDITDRKREEQELQKKNAEIEQFIYTVSHDLRSPLVTIKTFTGYLEKDLSGNDRERVAQDLAYIHGAADKMKLLLDELLEMSRIDRVETPPVRVLLRDVLAESLDALAGAISEHNADIHLPDTDLMLFGDRPRLCQIWQNLIENAVKYSRSDCVPRIELGVRRAGDETVFFVQDNGIGIAPEYRTRIFGMFDKLDPKSPGAGLGLSMVQRIIEKKGGRIWIDSVESGTGSCFLFTLPQTVVPD